MMRYGYQLVTIYHDERGEDAFLTGPLFLDRTLALADWFNDQTDEKNCLNDDGGFFNDEFTEAQWLQETLDQMAELNKTGVLFDLDTTTRIQEVLVLEDDEDVQNMKLMGAVRGIAYWVSQIVKGQEEAIRQMAMPAG